jgi:acyl-CoA synthetase (AMP-forming)/AMP-acid ligase II
VTFLAEESFPLGGLADLDGTRAVTVTDLPARIERRAAELQKQAANSVTLLPVKARNHSAFVIELLAAWRLQMPVWPVDPHLPEATLAELKARMEATAWPAGTALVLTTSGSTGIPKPCVFTFESLGRRFRALHRFVSRDLTGRTLCLLPLHFGHGLLCNTLGSLLNGSDVLLGEGFTPRVVSVLHEIVVDNGISFLSSTPVAWELVEQFGNAAKMPSLKRVHCASAPIGAEGIRKMRHWAGSAECWNVYGLTEFGGWVGGGRLSSEDARVDEFWGVDVKVENEEVFLRADFAAEHVGENRWFATGDRGRLENHGAVTLLGRRDFLINKGGMKIQPEEIERLSGILPAVRHSLCYGYSDPTWGEKIGLALVLKSGESLTEAEVRAHLRGHLSGYKIPDRIHFVKELVFTERGKLDRRASFAAVGGA